MTLEEYNKLGEKDPSTDLEVDRYQEELGKKEDNFIIEGRTSWYFIPHSVKIFIDVEEKEGARRIWEELRQSQDRNEGEPAETVEEIIERNRRRRESDQKRYQKYFGIDAYDKSNYDHVVDTTDKTPEEAFQEVYKLVASYLETETFS